MGEVTIILYLALEGVTMDKTLKAWKFPEARDK